VLFLHLVHQNQKQTQPVQARQKRISKILFAAPAAIVITTIVILVSGFFRYWALAVATGSMEPNVMTGDAVIIDRAPNSLADIELGTIIAFHMENKVVIHRLMELEIDNGVASARTKGDNNAAFDHWIVTDDELIGVVIMRVPVIGWPTVWLERTFNR
jgi:signal peptidase I